MSVKVNALSYFQRKAKRLTKKFRTLDDELANLITGLKQNPHPQQGKSLGAGLYKIRLASKSILIHSKHSWHLLAS